MKIVYFYRDKKYVKHFIRVLEHSSKITFKNVNSESFNYRRLLEVCQAHNIALILYFCVLSDTLQFLVPLLRGKIDNIHKVHGHTLRIVTSIRYVSRPCCGHFIKTH